ncbi:hypothetical protein TRIUR3_10813 [Triticum urartu]|uniref:Uncharacterized protein n=1 Tax=Triticum urartu TaxID=4572 RepID=M7ZIE8_TRIUA|nr:hypothetical protein TRIUR3_10813 [Triticum urartu]
MGNLSSLQILTRSAMNSGPSIPALPCAIGGCFVASRVADVTSDGEKSLVGLLLAETAATLPVVLHLDGVVFIPRSCNVWGVLCGVLCLVMPFDYTGGTQVSWRRLGPRAARSVLHSRHRVRFVLLALLLEEVCYIDQRCNENNTDTKDQRCNENNTDTKDQRCRDIVQRSALGLSCLMARDAGLPRVDNELDTKCCKIVTIQQVDSSAFSTWIGQMEDCEMPSPTPSRMGVKLPCQNEAHMSSVRISMVREQLRRVIDEDSYAPHYVPIGPYHRSRSSPWIEKTKKRSAGFLQSLSEEHTEGGLTGVMEKLEPLARELYTSGGGLGDMTPEQSSSMLLHDACYLLLFFVDYMSGNRAPPAPADDDEHPVSRNTLVRDAVFLRENQIPFFLLQGIHERVTGGTTSVLDYIAMPIQELLQQQLFSARLLPSHAAADQERGHVRHGGDGPVAPGGGVQQDGVESSVLDVQLEGGTLWIPRLRVDSNTWTILRNLMALEEQAHRRPVTAYCLFMSQLACTAEDVQLLRRAGIVDHFLGNDEQVSKDLAGLCNGVVIDIDDLDRNYLKPMWHQLENRFYSRAERFIGGFRHGQSWEITAAFLMALIVIACQAMQTFYAVARGGH